MWVDDKFLIRFAPLLHKKTKAQNNAASEWLTQFEGRPVLVPKKFSPDPEFLKRHAAKCAAMAKD